MKAKKSLLPKSKLWISLTLIFLPVLFLIITSQLDAFKEADNYLKVSKIAISITLIGMLVLFLTQWTKDDGDEMYVSMRLKAMIFGIVVGTLILLVTSVFSLIEWFDESGAFAYNGFGLMFFILGMQLFNFAQQMYALSKQKEE